jgi:(p)ppGpp synthase/HD superfamily hydrolase
MEQEPVTLGEFIAIACKVCERQTRQDGSPYCLHFMRIMLAVKAKGYDERYQMVAIGHDLLEDSDFTHMCIGDLEDMGLPQEVVDGIVAITKLPNEKYGDYLIRVKNNEFSRVVKIEDISDNSNIHELTVVDSYVLRRLDKYHGAMRFLTGKAEL